jgi:hypothetical protein
LKELLILFHAQIQAILTMWAGIAKRSFGIYVIRTAIGVIDTHTGYMDQYPLAFYATNFLVMGGYLYLTIFVYPVVSPHANHQEEIESSDIQSEKTGAP